MVEIVTNQGLMWLVVNAWHHKYVTQIHVQRPRAQIWKGWIKNVVEHGWANKCSKKKQSGLDGEHVPL